jgi:hypothetical protein
MLAKVNVELLVTPEVLPRALVTAVCCLKKMSESLTMLPEVKAMTLLTTQPKITLTRPKVKAMRRDEGCHI